MPHLFPLLLLLVIAGFVFSYHYERNGNPENWGDFFCRLFWAGSFALGYATLSNVNLDFRLIAWYLIGAFLELLVPSAFAQNMGRWAVPWSLQGLKKYWPGAWLPQYTQEQWTALSQSRKTCLDFLGMLSAGILRGAVVFLPGIFLGAPFFGSVLAAAAIALWHPVAYFVGFYIPFNIFGNVKNSAAWGEFLIGIGWAFALAASITL